jgi:hypothetical protein
MRHCRISVGFPYPYRRSSLWRQLSDIYLHVQGLPPCPKLLWSAIAMIIERSSSWRMILFRSESSTFPCAARSSICLFSNLSSSGHSILPSWLIRRDWSPEQAERPKTADQNREINWHPSAKSCAKPEIGAEHLPLREFLELMNSVPDPSSQTPQEQDA